VFVSYPISGFKKSQFVGMDYFKRNPNRGKRALPIAHFMKADVSPRGQCKDSTATFEKMGYLWLPPVLGYTRWCIPHWGNSQPKTSTFGHPQRSRSYTLDGEIPAARNSATSHCPPLCNQTMVAPWQMGSASMALIALVSPTTPAGKQVPTAPEAKTSSSVNEYGSPCNR